MDLVKHYPAADPNDALIGTLDEVIRCARPIHFQGNDETYRYWGNGSGFIAVRDDTWMLFTTSHVVKGQSPASLCVLPTDAADRWLFLRRWVRTESRLDGDTDLADVVCFTIDL